MSERKIDRVKRRFVEDGLAVALSGAPSGQARWSLRLLADRAVELELVEALSHETVRRVLKKTNSSRGRRLAG